MTCLMINSLTKSNILSGVSLGRRVLAALIKGAPATSGATPVFLDFRGIEVATSSFLRESVLAFRDTCAQSMPQLYPVVVNLNEAVEEELQFFVNERADALWCCDRTEAGQISNRRVLGRSRLEDGQRTTLDLVVKLKKASAPMLHKTDGSIQTTAWNNRLSALSSKRLIVEQREGKVKFFSPVLEASDGT
jgi:hypothetical protein